MEPQFVNITEFWLKKYSRLDLCLTIASDEAIVNSLSFDWKQWIDNKNMLENS